MAKADKPPSRLKRFLGSDPVSRAISVLAVVVSSVTGSCSIYQTYQSRKIAEESLIANERPSLEPVEMKHVEGLNYAMRVKNVGKTIGLNPTVTWEFALGEIYDDQFKVCETVPQLITARVPNIPVNVESEVSIFMPSPTIVKTFSNIERCKVGRLTGRIDYIDQKQRAYRFPWCYEVHNPYSGRKLGRSPCTGREALNYEAK